MVSRNHLLYIYIIVHMFKKTNKVSMDPILQKYSQMFMMMLFSTGLGWSVLGSLGRNQGCCWTGPQVLALYSSAKTRKKKGRQGLHPWPLRCLSQFLAGRKDRLLRERMFFCVSLRTFHRGGGLIFITYVFPIGW